MATKILGDMLPNLPKSKPKVISSELNAKIEVANKQWGKAKVAILDVYNHALADGWTGVEAAKICREKLTIFSPRTIRGILPDESKNQNMKRPQIQIAESLPQIEEVHKEISPRLKAHLESLPMNSGAKPKQVQREPEQKEPLSELSNQELEFMEENKEEYDRLMVTKNLTTKLSGLETNEIGRLISETAMESQWRRELVNQTLTHRLQIIKRMSPREVEVSMKLAQTLEHLLESFTDQLHDEILANKSKQEISGV